MLNIAFFPQEAFKEVSLVVNIEVPIRVYDGKTFVDNLTIDDFQVYEDGVRQRIEAVYLVKKREIERKEEKKKHSPKTSRNFFLFFEISEYTSRMGDAIDFFVDNVLLPQDKLWVITPMKAHRMREKVFEFRTKEDIREEFKSLLKKETAVGSSAYKSVLRDIEGIANALAAYINPRAQAGNDPTNFDIDEDEPGPPLEELCATYAACLSRLENLRKVDQLQLLDFAKFLKNMEGQKYVFLFYQREFIPRLDSQIMQMVQVGHQNNIAFTYAITNLQDFFKRDINFDVDLIKRAYADASVAIHFLFFSKPAESKFGLSMDEESNDIYGAFREMAHATGGFVDSSANPEYLFKQAVNAAESYYLLYYSPKKYVVDGKFKSIEVKVKGDKYKIVHRVGYFAD
jgi:VWFA-related protein